MELTLSQEAHDFAYRLGLREIAPLAQRVINLETILATLTARVERLEAEAKKQSPHLRSIEKRS